MARYRAGETDETAFYTAHYENLLDILAREWRFLELLIRYRRVGGPSKWRVMWRCTAWARVGGVHEATKNVEGDVAVHLLELE